MSRNIKNGLLGAVLAASVAGCVGGMGPDGTPPPNPMNPGDPTGSNGEPLASGGQDNTFNHDFDDRDPFDILSQEQTEGPPLIAMRLHSCQKMEYATLGTILSSLGVNLGNTATGSAGLLYSKGNQALGAPNYLARTREPTQNTTAGVTKMMDIFVQAAPEIIKAMPTQKACMVAGQPTQMFDASGKCTAAGVSCLKGSPASQQEVDLCNQAISDASSQQIGQSIAVGVILAAAHTCE
jgi:hypothetical protein